MKTKNDYSSINGLSQFLKIDADKLTKQLTGKVSIERRSQFRDVLISDMRGLIREFEYIEWKGEIDKFAEKKYIAIMFQIETAKIDSHKEIIIEIPVSDIKCKMDNGKKWKDKKITNKTFPYYFHDSSPTHTEDEQLHNYLHMMFPDQTIGVWYRVIKRLLKENYTLTLGKTWRHGGILEGTLTITW
ncbi:MAG: hypothetical protein ACD_80C00114G0004 [uncultured bacterium (gcode 4)]|uniref:Uncharacterized protein n=1 Tax=uncultured bacterium (gcode 4) TaxID=1234023 RepID=K1XJ02_9BACT|nr:MAG: hypothetical protein ACD_80C00114G0004 [uncultured bacterium (gcode 4)]HBB04281.1 hypothetical protein [Candidatus Gracilibacteria bacterium]